MPISLSRRSVLLGVCALASPGFAQSAAPDKVRVGGGSLSTRLALARGAFARRNLAVEIVSSGGSDGLRRNLAAGAIDLADYGVDNALAMRETAGADAVIVFTTNNIANELVAQPTIKTIADLAGKAILVDAPNTQNALSLRMILRKAGLEAGRDYQLKAAGPTPARLDAMRAAAANAATMASGPALIRIKREGFTSLGSTADLIGTMHYYCGFATPAWARAHRDVLTRYIAAHIETQRWLLAPANKADVLAALAADSAGAPSDAEAIYAEGVSANGWQKDGALNDARLQRVLDLRAAIEGDGKTRAPRARQFIDRSYYRAALKLAR